MNSSRYPNWTAPGGGGTELGALFAIQHFNTTNSTNSSLAPKPSSEGNSSSKRSHTGAIVGGVVGGLVGLAIIAGIALFLIRKRQYRPVQPVEPLEPPPPLSHEIDGSGKSELEQSISEIPSGHSPIEEAKPPLELPGSRPTPQEMP